MNNDTNTKEYFEKIHSLTLSESSRARMKGDLLAYAQFHAVADAVRVAETNRSMGYVPQRTAFITYLLKSKISKMTALLMIMLLVGGGTSFAAENTVPGDFLYPVKIEVNENIKSALAVSNEAEAQLQARFAEERLKEAGELAAEGKLDAKTSAQISTGLKAHYNDAIERSKKSEAKGDIQSSADVRTSLEGTFRAYGDVLAQLNANISGNDGEALISEVNTFADDAATAQATATTDISVTAKTNVKATIGRADELVTDAKGKLENAQDKISAETYARIKTRIDTAVSAQADAQTKFNTEQYKDAYVAAQSAMRAAHEVGAMTDSTLQFQSKTGVRTKNGEGEMNTRVETDTSAATGDADENDVDAETEDDTDADERENDSQTTNEVDIEGEVNTSIDTGILNTKINADTSVRENSKIEF